MRREVGITYARYSPHGADHLHTAQLIECYRDVFADEPWNEWLKCPNCEKYWGTKDRGLLSSFGFRHCDTPLVDFWPREQLVSDLYHEITPEASCWLAMQGEKVVGFCWGYPITAQKAEETTQLKLGIDSDEIIAYQDEVGVLSAYRGQKIAKEMIARRLEDFLHQGLQFGVVRTRRSPNPSVTFLWYTQKLGYEILATYPGDDGRVILGRKLAGLQELLSS